MNISNAVGPQAGLISTHQPNAVPSRMEPTANLPPITPEILNSKVSISGQALLKQRIFDGAEPRHRPLSVANTSASLFMNSADFLTRQDCQLLGEVYAFAQEGGADLQFVDNLGFSLADYRSLHNGERMGPHNNGTAFDSKGHMVSYTFSDKDAVTVKRILASDALKTTQLDQGFIRFQTDIAYAANTYTHYEFMEQVINKFSAKGTDVAPLDASFSRYEHNKRTGIEHLSKEVYEFGPNGPVRKGTVAANDPSAALNQKKNALKTKPTTPESIQD
ncbi:MAG: hypothetical protein JWP80_437, partial [Pseudomonas sp.]|nr:hypothetical protein [Pseudomonas sp.]